MKINPLNVKMPRMLYWLTPVMFTLACFIISACKKGSVTAPITAPKTSSALYADSVFYIQNSNDYFVTPVITKKGTFTSFPDGLNIDQNTGVINVNKSETGLKYRITFTPSGSNTATSAFIIISGINYTDKIFNLSLGDSLAVPVYNANKSLAMPGTTNAFDVSGGCKDAGIAVGGNNGIINLAKTVRSQGIDTGSTAEVKLAYKINDNSHGAINGLDVQIYFYRTAKDIPQYLLDIINERKTTILVSSSPTRSLIQSRSLLAGSVALNALTLNPAPKPSRPRPPCIVVVSR